MAEILKKTKCNVEIPISAQHIILGSDMLDYSINLFIVLIKYYVSPHFGGEAYCFCPVRLSVTQFVSATSLKLLT